MFNIFGELYSLSLKASEVIKLDCTDEEVDSVREDISDGAGYIGMSLTKNYTKLSDLLPLLKGAIDSKDDEMIFRCLSEARFEVMGMETDLRNLADELRSLMVITDHFKSIDSADTTDSFGSE